MSVETEPAPLSSSEKNKIDLNYQKNLKQKKENFEGRLRDLEARDRLGLGEEVDGGIRLGDGSEELEERAKASDSEERELGADVPQAASESECDLAVHSLRGQRVDQIADRGGW